MEQSAGTYGVVAAVGPGVSYRETEIGDRVMVRHHWGCGACRHCRAGWADGDHLRHQRAWQRGRGFC
ncbi:MAG TPA: alcohol dehydrogenase catalytic domain-containing protein [Xanthobacteraceae bacterium]